jgi:hypothetical protein
LDAVNEHLEETRGHVKRLEQVFETIGVEPESEHCDGMEGLISEGSEMAEATGDGDARDAALIGAAQRVEHYEIAAYGTARTLAKHQVVGRASGRGADAAARGKVRARDRDAVERGGRLGARRVCGAQPTRTPLSPKEPGNRDP